jgi:hypothetical protein
LNTHSPKKKKARKPITAIIILRVLPKSPRLINPKNFEINPSSDSSSHITPVKNPRKIPKMLQWQ